MKNIVFAGLIILFFLTESCGGQASDQKVAANTGTDVEVYYFHMTTRCITCKTVEAEARKNIEMLYPGQVKSGNVSFTALNLEEPAGKAMGGRLGVNSQTLLIVKGDQKINITNEGFLYAVSKPDKFKEIIKDKIDPLLK